MAAPLPTLRAKLSRRKKGRKRQLRLFKRTRKKGHRKQAGKHGRAARKLVELIEKAKRRWRINWSGKQPVGGKNLRRVVRYALANFDVYVTSTNGGTHSSTSYHYRNQAVDIGSNSAEEKARCQRGIYNKFGPGMFAELFGPDNGYFVKDGSRYTATEGEFNEDLHDDHVHVAVTS